MAGKQEWDRLTPTRWLVQLLVRRFSGLRGIRRNSSVMSAPRAATAGNGPVPRGWPRSTWGYGDWGGLDVGADGRAAGWPDQRRRCRYLRRAHLRAQPAGRPAGAAFTGIRRSAHCYRGLRRDAVPDPSAAPGSQRPAGADRADQPDPVTDRVPPGLAVDRGAQCGRAVRGTSARHEGAGGTADERSLAEAAGAEGRAVQPDRRVLSGQNQRGAEPVHRRYARRAGWGAAADSQPGGATEPAKPGPPGDHYNWPYNPPMICVALSWFHEVSSIFPNRAPLPFGNFIFQSSRWFPTSQRIACGYALYRPLEKHRSGTFQSRDSRK